MGLDLQCNDMYIRVGSYSTMSKLRSVLVRCTYEFIKNQEKNENTGELLEHLDKILVGDVWISPFVSSVGYTHIHNNYSEIHRLLLNFNCEGLLLFVCHSDCDGFHSVNHVKKIIKWLKQIFSYEKNELILYKNNFINETLETGALSLYERFYLSEILEHSVETNEPIEYC